MGGPWAGGGAAGAGGRWARTLQALVHAPVDAQAVLLLLHTPLAAAVVERLLFERLHGAAALVLGFQAGCQAEVGLLAGHALPQRAVLGAAALLLQALIAGFHTIQAVPAAHLRGQEHVCGWRGGRVSAAGQGPAASPPREGACTARLLRRPAPRAGPPLYAQSPFSLPGTSCLLGLPRRPTLQGPRGFAGFPWVATKPSAASGQSCGSPRPWPHNRPGPAGLKSRGLPERRAAAGGAGEPLSSAGSTGALFREKFSLRSLYPGPIRAHTPPARRISTSSPGLARGAESRAGVLGPHPLASRRGH